MGKRNRILLEENEDDDAVATKSFQKEKKEERKKKVKHEEEYEEALDDEEHFQTNETVTETDQTSSSSLLKKKKKKKSKPSEEEDPEKKSYQRLILFVGQIPFEATQADLVQHFENHGVKDVQVRLLTEKGTNKSRGMAFVDFESPQHLVRGLRVDKTRLFGRAINVERTVGGGGNNEKRKQKLKDLKEFQGSRVRKDVDALLDDAISRSNGLITRVDADELVCRALGVLPRDAAKQVLDEILESDIANARNKKAWILGCIKRYIGRLKSGEQFLTLEEEKAGVIEKRKPKPRLQRSSHNNGSAMTTTTTHTTTKPTMREPPQIRKFKRGGIGSANKN